MNYTGDSPISRSSFTYADHRNADRLYGWVRQPSPYGVLKNPSEITKQTMAARLVMTLGGDNKLKRIQGSYDQIVSIEALAFRNGAPFKNLKCTSSVAVDWYSFAE